MAMDTEQPRTKSPATAMGMDQPRTKSPATATDMNRLCQTGATTVDHDQPMRLRCRGDRVWLCPTGPVAPRFTVEPKSIHATSRPGVIAGRFCLWGRRAPVQPLGVGVVGLIFVHAGQVLQSYGQIGLGCAELLADA